MPRMSDPKVGLEMALNSGLIPVLCRREECGAILALQSSDGNTLYVNQNGRSFRRIALTCKCGKQWTWRPSRG